MRRQAPKGDFRSNLHRGGIGKAARASAAEQAVAVRAAQVLGLGIAGVDLIRSRRGPLVLEVNSSPGLEGIEPATGVDIAGCVKIGRASCRERVGKYGWIWVVGG